MKQQRKIEFKISKDARAAKQIVYYLWIFVSEKGGVMNRIKCLQFFSLFAQILDRDREG